MFLNRAIRKEIACHYGVKFVPIIRGFITTTTEQIALF